MTNIGSILGAVLIVGGLYTILWGQRKERKTLSQLTMSLPNSMELSKDSHAPDIVISFPKITDDRLKDGSSVDGPTISGSTRVSTGEQAR